MNTGQQNGITHQQARYFLHIGRGQLVAAEQTALDSHLAGCADCRRYADEVTGLHHRLAQTMRRRWQNQPPGPQINEQVQARVRRKIGQRQAWRLANSVAATAAIVLIMAALGWLAWRIRPLPDKPVAPATQTAPVWPPLPAPAPAEWSTLPGLTTFGNQAKLLGYNLSAASVAPGDTVELSFYGQTRFADVTFFVYLLDSANQLAAQAEAADCPPTNQHSIDLMITCAALSLPNNLPDGPYQLRVGAYNRSSGQRLTTPAGDETFLLTSLQVAVPPSLLPTPAPTPTPYSIPASCPVTLPNGNPPPGQSISASYHGNGRLWTSLLPNGVLVPPENIRPDGKLTYNWWWWRGQPGQLTIKGRRLDDLNTPPLEAEITPGFGDSGYQDSWLVFPTEGCWEVTGTVGDSTLTFVVYVAKVDRLQ